MRVRNINGTSQRACKCGSWLEHWRNFSGQQANICRAAGCSRKDLAGAHVQKDVNYDNRWYIVPFCTFHNKASDPVELVKGTGLVPAYKRETCER